MNDTDLEKGSSPQIHLSEGKSPTSDSKTDAHLVYPQDYFNLRLDEEVLRAQRERTILMLILLPVYPHADLVAAVRSCLRKTDALGFWNQRLAVLLMESVRNDRNPQTMEARINRFSAAIFRVSGSLNAVMKTRIAVGASFLPDTLGTPLRAAALRNGAEKALNASLTGNQSPILFAGEDSYIQITSITPKLPVLLVGGNVRMDVDQRHVWAGAQPVELLQKEFDLLYQLLRNPGRVLKRGYLCETIWGYSYFGTTRTVDVHIARLRKKLHHSEHLRITTIQGQGYRLDIDEE